MVTEKNTTKIKLKTITKKMNSPRPGITVLEHFPPEHHDASPHPHPSSSHLRRGAGVGS